MRKKVKKIITRIVPLFGLIFLLIILSTLPLYVSSRPGLCRLCHRMQGYYDTWQRSTHAKVGCTKCHGPVFNLLSAEEMSNKVCTECHNVRRTVTPIGDIKIPPRHHLASEGGMRCVSCHQKLVHAKYHVDANHPPEKVCMDCHKKRNVSTDCPTCHYAR